MQWQINFEFILLFGSSNSNNTDEAYINFSPIFSALQVHQCALHQIIILCHAHTHSHIRAGAWVSRRRVHRGLHLVKQHRSHQLVIRLLSFHLARLTSTKNPFHSRIHNNTEQVIFLPSTWLCTDWAPLFPHQFLERFSKLANAVSDLNKFIFYQYFHFVATNDSEEFVIELKPRKSHQTQTNTYICQDIRSITEMMYSWFYKF